MLTKDEVLAAIRNARMPRGRPSNERPRGYAVHFDPTAGDYELYVHDRDRLNHGYTFPYIYAASYLDEHDAHTAGRRALVGLKQLAPAAVAPSPDPWRLQWHRPLVSLRPVKKSRARAA